MQISLTNAEKSIKRPEITGKGHYTLSQVCWEVSSGDEQSTGGVRVVNSISSPVIVRPSNPGGHCRPVAIDRPGCRCLDMDG